MAGCHLKPIHKNEFNAPAKFAFNRPGPQASVAAILKLLEWRQVERSKEIPGSSALLET